LTQDPIYERLQQLPKVELHRHWEASMRLDTLIDIAKDYGIEMPEYEIETLRPFVQVMPGEPHSMQHFLGKFAMLRQFYRSIEVIERITREIVIDAAEDNVRYMELRFTPKALCNISQCSVDQVVEMVCQTAQKTAKEHDITVRLIASMNRHESVKFGERVLRSAIDHKKDGIVGLDLAGNEQMSALPFRGIFQDAKQEGLGITIHAGEWDGANSVWDAVGNMNADRIGHGVRVLEDPAITNILIEREMVLEICPSSNVLSGIVSSLEDHALPDLIHQQMQITINTDDPIICNINLTDELYHTVKYMNLTIDDVKKSMICATRASFLPAQERDTLVTQFQSWLSDI
jgi:adenosine deaminase